jgi:hypothetical protein
VTELRYNERSAPAFRLVIIPPAFRSKVPLFSHCSVRSGGNWASYEQLTDVRRLSNVSGTSPLNRVAQDFASALVGLAAKSNPVAGPSSALDESAGHDHVAPFEGSSPPLPLTRTASAKVWRRLGITAVAERNAGKSSEPGSLQASEATGERAESKLWEAEEKVVFSYQGADFPLLFRYTSFRTTSEARTYEAQVRQKTQRGRSAESVSVNDTSYTALHDALGPLWNKRSSCALALLPLLNGLGTASVLKVLDGDRHTKLYLAVYEIPIPVTSMPEIATSLMTSSSKSLWALKVMPGLVPARAGDEGMTLVVADFVTRRLAATSKRDAAAENRRVAAETRRHEEFIRHLAKEVLRIGQRRRGENEIQRL